MDEQFDWSDKNESVVVRQVEAIAVFENDSGGIVILQHRWPDEDEMIYFPRSCLKAVIAALCRVQKESDGG